MKATLGTSPIGTSRYQHACPGPGCGRPVGWEGRLCWDCDEAERLGNPPPRVLQRLRAARRRPRARGVFA